MKCEHPRLFMLSLGLYGDDNEGTTRCSNEHYRRNPAGVQQDIVQRSLTLARHGHHDLLGRAFLS
jgi:hypothetical protein